MSLAKTFHLLEERGAERFCQMFSTPGLRECVTVAVDGRVTVRERGRAGRMGNWLGRKLEILDPKEEAEKHVYRLMNECAEFVKKHELEGKELHTLFRLHPVFTLIDKFVATLEGKRYGPKGTETNSKGFESYVRIQQAKQTTFFHNGFCIKDSIDSQKSQELQKRALAWKERNKKLLYQNVSHLNEREIRQITKLTKYTNTIYLLFSQDNSLLEDKIFRAALQYNLPISLIAHSPFIVETLFDKHIAGAIGRGGKKGIRIQKENDKQWVEIKIENKWVPFSLNQEAHSPHAESLRSIFSEFSKGNPETCRWSYFPEEGFIRWNAYKMIRYDKNWNPIPHSFDGDPLDVFMNMPVYEKITGQQAKQRYGESFEGRKNHLVVRCSGANKELDIQDWHGFYDLVLYEKDDQGEDIYRIFPIGKYAKNWPNPRSPLQLAAFLGKTGEGTMAYPDPNDHMANRLHCYVPIALEKQESDILMEGIRLAMVEAREGRSIFQVAGKNCIAHVEELLDQVEAILRNKGNEVPKTLHSAFRLSSFYDIRKVNPQQNILRRIFQLINLCKQPRLQAFLMNLLYHAFGMHRKYKSISVLNHNPDLKNKKLIRLPAKIYQDVLKDPQRGEVLFGYSRISTAAAA